MTAPPTIGVIGLGSIGRRHARLLAERNDVAVRVFDVDPEAFHDVVGLEAAASVEQLLAGCRGVVIAAPDALHAPLTIAACQAGVAVLVEKPVSDSLVAAREMAAVAAASGVPVLVGHVLRHLPILGRAEELLDDGAIGAPVSFHATLGAYETVERARVRFAGADRYRLPFDYSHEWHYVQWLLGPVERCVATGHVGGDMPVRPDPNVVDVLLVQQSGVTGTVHLDYVERDGARAIRIVGDHGVMEVDLRGGTITLACGAERRVEQHAEHRDVAFRRQLDHFLDVVEGVPPMVTIEEAARAVAVAEAVVASCEEGTWQGLDT